MTMTPYARKLSLTTHLTFSIGWFGAIAAFMALAITGLISNDSQVVRSAYIAIELIGWLIIVPSCIGSLLSGVVQAAGTQWGLFRYYWIVVKLVLTLISTLVLFLHMRPISYLSDMAQKVIFTSEDFRGLRVQLLVDAGAALLVLLVCITISVYKPWGKTPWEVSKLNGRNTGTVVENLNKKSFGLYILVGLILLVVGLFIAAHWSGMLPKH